MKLTKLSKEQINHLCAMAQEWSLDTSERQLYIGGGHFDRIRTLLWVDSKGECICRKDEYNPLHNKAQAIDLLIEFGIAKDPRPNGNSIYRILKHGTGSQLLKVYEFISGDHGHMKAICLAVIASVWGDDVPDELLEKADE